MENPWISPDGKIKKCIERNGIWGFKPTDNCECIIEISNCTAPEVEKYSSVNFVKIGDSDNNFERLLDRCLITMFPEEVATVTFKLDHERALSFTLKLTSFVSKGFVYEWNAKKKYDLAMTNKERGFELYNESRYIDASHRFSKSLKLLSSIPLEVDEPPIEINGIQVEEILDLKIILYNNLASCYLKSCDYETVLLLISKVLQRDVKNVKALYKKAIAQCETHDYEGSRASLVKLLEIDPENKAAADKLKFVNVKVTEDNLKVNMIIKNMFK